MNTDRAAASLAARRRLCAAYAAGLAVVSLAPARLFPAPEADVPGLDKLVHVALYAGLGLLLRWAAEGRRGGAREWAVPLAGAVYGLLLEVGQLVLTGGERTFSWGDALANLAGVELAWHLTGRLRRVGRGTTVPAT